MNEGPALSGTLVQTIGFGWMLFGIAMINFMYAPLLYFLRNPPTKEERQVTHRVDGSSLMGPTQSFSLSLSLFLCSRC